MAGRSKHAAMPADFREYAMSHRVDETRAHYGIGYSLFRRWCFELGIFETISARPKNPCPPKAMPADFAQHAHLRNAALSKVYPGYSLGLFARWRAQIGMSQHGGSAPEPAPPGFKATVATMYIAQACRHYERSEPTIKRWAEETGARFATWRGWKGPAAAPVIDHRASDLAGQAQRHLQRIGPVFKCGDDYSVFGRTMPAGAMVEFAKGKGFDPDSWRRL